MSTKLSFRARALDPSKAMPIYFAEELPDIQEYSAINRAVPQMPSGMEKEEESEHHLQRAIIAGLIIPTPEVSDVKDEGFYDKIYPSDFKMPRQLIHVQPLSLEQDIPDYDMDSADELWLDSQHTKLTDLTHYKFEQMMDRLEKITVCSLDDAKALVKRNEVNQDVFDYWVNKRLKTKHPLILAVKTENRGNSTSNNPYIAFRRRTEKMQTRKNRKNDETSYEKMLKLRRDLSRAVKLLEMVKRREKTKREELQMSIDIFEKRYHAKDYSGQLLSEYTSAATKLRPAFAPLYSNQYHHQHGSSISSSQNHWNSSQSFANQHLNHHLQTNKRDFDGLSTSSSRKEKRQYKKRKHKAPREIKPVEPYDGMFSSEEEDLHSNQLVASESEDEGVYPFRRNRNCDYYQPHGEGFGNWPWEAPNENMTGDPKYRYNLTSIRLPRPRCIGFARRRVGRGGRILLDRASSNYDDIWARLDYTIFDSAKTTQLKSECTERVPELLEGKTSVSEDCEKELQPGHSQQYTQQNGIVIKSENSKNQEITNDVTDKTFSGLGTVSHQKLDDFEQLLDSANANSNIINKNLVCRKNSEISDENASVMHSGHTYSELLNKDSLSDINEGMNSDLVNSNGTLKATTSETMDFKQTEDEEVESLTSHGPEDFYETLVDEINSDWLHFRPQTPPSSSPETIFESDFIQSSKRFAVELQMLEGLKESDLNTNTGMDSIYLSQSISFNANSNAFNWSEDSENEPRVKAEPVDDLFVNYEEPKDAVLKLIEKYQKDISQKNGSESFHIDDINFVDYISEDKNLGCSKFKITDSTAVAKPSTRPDVQIKTEKDEASLESNCSSVFKEAPIAELQSHNYVLQYGSPVASNTVNLNTSVPSKNLISCNPNINVPVDSGSTTLFQQPFMNSGGTIITTQQQPQQNKLQPIAYDNNTIVLATQTRKQINGPLDRNLNPSKYKQVYMLDLTQDKRKKAELGVNLELGVGTQSILVSNVNSNILSANNTMSSVSPLNQTQQFSLVHQNALQKPLILSTSSAAAAGTLLQTSQSNVSNKIMTPQLSGFLYSTHGKVIIPSSNPQNIILDSKVISSNSQLSTQKLQTQQRSKMENTFNIIRENSEKNVIYAKKFSTPPGGQQSLGILSQGKTVQRIQQQQPQQQILRPQYTASSSTKIIQQPNNGNNILGSVNTKNDNQVNSSTQR